MGAGPLYTYLSYIHLHKIVAKLDKEFQLHTAAPSVQMTVFLLENCPAKIAAKILCCCIDRSLQLRHQFVSVISPTLHRNSIVRYLVKFRYLPRNAFF